MNQKKNLSTSSRCATFIWAVALALIICAASAGKVSAAAADSLDQLYEKAKKEGKITLYAPLSPQAMSVIPPAFMKRFPGVTVDHIDATSDKLIARVLAEQKGGRVIADVISGALTYLPQILDLKIVEHVVIPEPDQVPLLHAQVGLKPLDLIPPEVGLLWATFMHRLVVAPSKVAYLDHLGTDRSLHSLNLKAGELAAEWSLHRGGHYRLPAVPGAADLARGVP